MQISQLAASAKPSATLALNSQAKQMIAAGEDVVMFTVGEPDFDTPDNIKQAAIRAALSGHTKYTPAAGTVELREAICEKFRSDNNLEYGPGQVFVSNGAKQALYISMLCLLDAGDEVLLPAPYWVSYASQARFCGAEPVPIDCTETENLKLTPELLRDAITGRSKLLVLNSPCNPSGVVYERDELAAIMETAAEADLWVFSDEVYEKLIYDGLEHFSPAALGEEVARRTITFNAVSKTYAMTGWRIGYAAGPEEVITAAGRLQSNISSGPNSIAQKAAVEAITGPQDSIEDMHSAFLARRDLIVDGLNEIEGVRCLRPNGAFYALPDCSDLLGKSYDGREVTDSISLSEALLETVGLAVVPGTPFGAERYLRFSYATAEEQIEQGLERLQKFVAMKD